MAFNPSPEVADCRDIARRRGWKQVIVVGIDPVSGRFGTFSYGETKALCDDAKRMNIKIHTLIQDGLL